MKLYVFTLKKLVAGIAAIVCLVALISLNYNSSVAVFRTQSIKELPIYCVDTPKKICALTFDAAWGAEDTDKLIKILEKYDAKATFFVVGDWVKKFPEEVKRLHDAGHDVMNHSDTHKYMTKLDNASLIAEVENCSDKIEKVTGVRPTLFRAPYGDYDSRVVAKLLEKGYFTIQWDVDSLDWKNLGKENILNRVLNKTKNGSIILMHNGTKDTANVLDEMIKKLKEKGFNFKPISEFIYRENYTIDHTWKIENVAADFFVFYNSFF